MKAILLHLSDIHVTGANNPILKHAADIAACTFLSLPDASAVFILISGDVAFSGKEDQYILATVFLNEIKAAIQKEKNIPIHFVIAPGNHDCDFVLDTRSRQIIVNSISSGTEPADKIDSSIIDQCTAIQNAFFEFKNKLETTTARTGDKLWSSHMYVVDGKTLIFDVLNLSWVSQKVEELGNVVFPHVRYVGKEHEAHNLRITVMHHPMNWIGSGYREFRQFIRKLSSIIITGHEHKANIGINIDSESMESVYIEGAVLQDKDISNSSFNLVTLDLDETSYKVDQFKWQSERYEPTEEGSWSEYKKLPPKRRNKFEIQSEFKETLEDPGANFRHAGRSKISLQDIYIYPDMTEIGKNRSPSSFLNSSTLLDPDKTMKGILLAGEDKVGCTSILYRLYDEYHDRGFVPIYLTGSSFKQSSTKDIETLIKRAVHEQYGKSAQVNFEQLSIDKKLLLLDDFDDCHSKSIVEQAAILASLRSRFGYLVVTVGELFEVRELLSKFESNDIQEFIHYRVQPFGYSLRHKLIKKWMLLGNDESNETQIVAKIDIAEKAMDAVMSRNLIPSMPLYLLTMLQSIEAGRGGEFKDSALGHYYNYLLNTGFIAANIRGDKLNEMFDYCTELAWYFHEKKCPELSRNDLLTFNEYFSKKFTTVDFNERLEKLIRSNVLIHRGDEYFYFRYPYSYYFLKGRYLSRNLKDAKVREYVEKCSNHLYVRDNANTLLFLAHHSNDEFVLDTIVNSIRKLFDKCNPVSFIKDTDKIASLIADAANLKLSYTETPPTEFREKINKDRDEYVVVNGSDGLAESEEDGDGLSLIAQIVTLFKTVEILGQILKNQYSNIDRDRKEFILNELFSGPLRALSSFYDLITRNPDQLVNEIDSALKDRSKLEDEQERKRIATQIVARLIQFISLGFIFKASSSVNADALFENIHSVVEKNKTPAYRLIELGVLLDSPKPIPRNELLQLKGAVANDVIALSMIQLLVIRRLYMFDTSYEDKQWLQSKLQIDLGFQQALDFKSSKAKLVK